jgi:hypothetical protein
MRTEKTIEMASRPSSSTGGSGRMSTTMIAMMPMARPISVVPTVLPIVLKLGSLNPGGGVAERSAMRHALI